MQEKPYFCPNCRSNRIKFNVITSYAQSFMKDAHSGHFMEFHDPNVVPEPETDDTMPNLQLYRQ
ncbi:hypothetical protein [Paenibacillus roseipurpureus]|uniref:Uncharacterized protein n=1 Tax=Paenibacillus roseopurpureus TaxID=2918901 RepID=A0AA96LY27_9BACL|nr:hypothetical protein [Paenibacillus sp. MBLB1832]WNR46630.1 hypothetical protein MJB10_11235 [Paenibacillus sp. MBLB1832]